MTKNYQSNAGVTDVNSADMRCYQMKAGTGTATVAAGETLGFLALSAVTHFGPVQFYAARVPDGADINTWEAAGNVWFKIGSITAVPPMGSSEATWPAYSQFSLSSFPCPPPPPLFLTPSREHSFKKSKANTRPTDKKQVDVVIPKNMPSGKYLIRVESIALHQAQSVGGAQVYLSCAQVEVTGGGSGTPGPLVSFPGAYKASDPGLIWSYYPVPTSYTAPGPAVWTG